MKLTKLSLIASILLCSNVAVAQPLEEAIKGVDVSGMLRYRYTDDRYKNQGFTRDRNGEASSANHQWRAEALFKTPVVNNVALNLGIRYHNAQQSVNHGKNANGLGNNLGAGKDSSFGVSEFKATITPDSTNTTITLGKMVLPTPLSDTLDDRGTGILVMNSDVTHWTFVAGAFDAWSLDDLNAGYALPDPDYTSIAKPLYTIAALGNYETSAGNVDAQVWGFYIKDMLNSGIFTQLGFSNSLFNVVGQYAYAKLENDADKTFTALYGKRIEDTADLYTINAGVKFHDYNIPLELKAGYIGNTQDSYAVSLDNEGSFNKLGQIWFEGNATGINISVAPLGGAAIMPGVGESNELSLFQVGASYDILENLKVGIDYVNGTNKMSRLNGTNTLSTEKRDFQEITPNFSWQQSKNLNISGYYAMLKTETDAPETATTTNSEDKNEFRLQVKYSF